MTTYFRLSLKSKKNLDERKKITKVRASENIVVIEIDLPPIKTEKFLKPFTPFFKPKESIINCLSK